MPILGIIASSKLVKTFISTIVTAQANLIAIPWVANAFGTKYSDPGTTPPTDIRRVGFNFTPDTFSLTNDSTPYIGAYAITASAWGSKYSDPATALINTGYSSAFSPNNSYLAAGHGSSPYISAYAWSPGFGTKYSSPASPPPGIVQNLVFSKTNDAIVCANEGSPFSTAYAWSGSGFGSKYSDPSPSMSTRGSATLLVINSTGDVVVYGNGGTPYWSAYAWSGSGYGSKYSDPATALTALPRGLSFNSAGNAVATGTLSTPVAYAWSSGFGTKYSSPTAHTNTIGFCMFSDDGKDIVYSRNAGSFPTITSTLHVYNWTSGSGFGTLYSSSTGLTTNQSTKNLLFPGL